MKLDEMTWPEIEQCEGDRVVALLPIAATEQHGHHLPLQVDRRITEELVRRLEAPRADWLVTAPTLWLGSSHHHIDFPGTLSVTNDVYINVLVGLLESLLRGGFRRIVVFNGHGGNIIPMQDALVRVRRRVGNQQEIHLVGCTYWTVAGQRMHDEAGMETPRITHACEYETSMMLHLDPDLVHGDRAKAGCPELPSRYLDVTSHSTSTVFAAMTMAQTTAGTGAMGRPELASADKGAKLLETVADAVGTFLDEFRGWPFVEGRRDRG